MKTYLHIKSGGPVIDTRGARGTVEPRAYASGDATLEDLQAAVGGYVELIDVAPGVALWINEEGKYNGSHLNDLATAMLYALAPEWIGYDVIIGDALLEIEVAS